VPEVGLEPTRPEGHPILSPKGAPRLAPHGPSKTPLSRGFCTFSYSETSLIPPRPSGDCRQNCHLLRRCAARLLGRSPEALDAVQDAFLIALREVGQARDAEKVGGWLRAVWRNVCLRRLRKGREVILFGELAPRLEGFLLEPSAEEAIDELALREWLWTALTELPEALGLRPCCATSEAILPTRRYRSSSACLLEQSRVASIRRRLRPYPKTGSISTSSSRRM
jgi:sigma-70-like protein